MVKNEKDKIQESSEESSEESKESKEKVKPPKVLRDPNTGEPLRTQSPGVPNSPWVGKHTDRDMEDPLYAEKMKQQQEKRLEQDLEEEKE